ncbi:4'-phosphopantetheine phosphatase-like isoform X3 [Homarus americanus]|uniref:4'-phosphopantetheine phosphatase-like isoform X3 n=1 Tax=Homarus americanus TaxID=6706 RepID=UPI001C4744F7|nr:4'-phosphopantetheine phosphatase-like isoform X3 [Homarus americanus]
MEINKSLGELPDISTPDMEAQKYAGSILLPDTDVVFRNIKNAKRFAIDIGGSLTKIAYYSTVSHRKVLYRYNAEKDSAASVDGDDYQYESSETERLHFVKFETKYIEHCLDFIRNHLVFSKESMAGKSIKATGGGAYKYAELIQQKLGLTVEKEDEIGSLIKGCNFLLRNIPDEQFSYSRHEDPEYRFINTEPNIFPYLLVNIGSGVSIMKVEADDKYERIGGTSMGGGTFWGLGSLLTKAKGFDELLQLASEGDHRNVDLLVKDIYGGDYSALGLTGGIIASSFGKAMHHGHTKNDDSPGFSEADIARSLLFTVSNDIGQIASLYAMLHGLKKVYFGGYFLRNHPVSMHTISFAIKYWSRGAVQALFLRHEGYLGAIGAFLQGAEECDTEKYSWGENYAGSSGLQSPLPHPPVGGWPGGTIDQLEIDRCDQQLTFFPLLAHPEEYVPDAVDLTKDKEARDYWLSCFEGSLGSFVNCAINSQPNIPDSRERANKFRDKYLQRLNNLKNHPFAYGNLTVRSLLDMREHCLNEFDFPDPYLQQKKLENENALKLLKDHLKVLDGLEYNKRQEALVRGILAGNVFDWGAKEVVELMEQGLGFKEAADKLQARPWLHDDLDAWISRQQQSPYKCAVIFLDNSGCDVVLGIIPFARELLVRGTRVVLCANSKPALNDVTAEELNMLMKQVAGVCPIISQHLETDTLCIRESGQASPCLDLSRLPLSLVDELVQWGCDLVMMEGMGRAIHTNLLTPLTCDSLKLAVIKNRWLAHRLGGDMFSVMCKYETGSKKVIGNSSTTASSLSSASS